MYLYLSDTTSKMSAFMQLQHAMWFLWIWSCKPC